jgi:hypothetical protein
MLRKRLEAELTSDGSDIRLLLDKKARFERDNRRHGGHGGPSQWR